MDRRASKRRRVGEANGASASPLSAFAIAKARLEQKSLDGDVLNGTANDQLNDAVIKDHTANDVEELSDYGDEEDQDRIDDDVGEQIADEVLLSTWIPTADSVIDDSGERTALRLAHTQTLCCIGHYKVIVQQGVVEINGAVLSKGRDHYPVYAPSTTALPLIQCMSRHGAIVELSSLSDYQASAGRLELFSPLFSHIWTADSQRPDEDRSNQRTFAILLRSSDDALRRPLRTLETPPEWRVHSHPGAGQLERPQTIALVGRQTTGKNELCRFLINGLCTSSPSRAGRIFLVDLDPVHQSFNLLGQVTALRFDQPVFGPSYALAIRDIDPRPYTPIRSHVITSTSLQQDEQHVVACAKDLVSACLRHASTQASTESPPTIIIKCPEFSQGYGSSLTLALLKALQPRKVLSLAQGPSKLHTDLATICPLGSLHDLPPLPPTFTTRTVDDLKEMHIMALVHNDPKLGGMPLSHRKPYCVSFADHNADFRAIACYPDLPQAKKLGSLITASLLSVVWVEDAEKPRLEVKREQHTKLPFVNHLPGSSTEILDPKHSSLIGVIFLRAIDIQQQILEIIPVDGGASYDKLPPDRLLLIHGAFETPKALLTESLYWKEKSRILPPTPRLVDDSLDTLQHAVPTPYVEILDKEDRTNAGQTSRYFKAGAAT